MTATKIATHRDDDGTDNRGHMPLSECLAGCIEEWSAEPVWQTLGNGQCGTKRVGSSFRRRGRNPCGTVSVKVTSG